MPLHILLILVVGGIGGIALALHLLGLSRTAPLTCDSAAAAWQRHFPDDTIFDVDVTTNGGAARITSAQGRGLVWQMGADTCARLLDGQQKIHLHKGRVIVRLNDYAAPRIRLDLTPHEQDAWADWMTQR
ncbi:MAG: hypothetical protein AB3N09_12645 [Tateyamaria sp.]